MQLPTTQLSRRIDPVLEAIGKAISWIWLVLMAMIVFNVVMRYAFGAGRIEYEEIQWHLYAVGFLLGLGYAYQADSHIRVDVLHARFSDRTIAWIELYGIVLLLLPFMALVLYYSVPFVMVSYELQEVSQAPGGLSHRWLIKAALPIGFLLLLAAVVSRLSRVWSYLFFTDGQSRGR